MRFRPSTAFGFGGCGKGSVLKAAVDFSEERIFHVEQSEKGNHVINGQYHNSLHLHGPDSMSGVKRISGVG